MSTRLFVFLLCILSWSPASAVPVFESGATVDSIVADSSTLIRIDGDSVIIESQDGSESGVQVVQLTGLTLTVIVLSIVSLIAGIFFFLRWRKQKTEQNEQVIAQLTERELAIAKMIQAGKSNKEIADELFISLSTVKTHINNIYKKLEISSRKEISRFLLS